MHLSFLPGRVREYDVEEAAFFTGFLTLEKQLSVFGEFENPDAIFEIGLIGSLQAVDVAEALLLLAPPLGQHAIEEGLIDVPIQFVNVHGVDAFLEAIVVGLMADDCCFLLIPLGRVAVVQRFPHPIEHFIVKAKATEQSRELGFQNFLADVPFRAFSLVTSAMVVDVSSLLDLANERAAAVAAGKKT